MNKFESMRNNRTSFELRRRRERRNVTCHGVKMMGFFGAVLLALTAGLGAAWAQPTLTMLHPTEGQQLPGLKEVFVYGEVTPGSTLTVNGNLISVHPQGGYLAMVPLQPGPVTLAAEAVSPAGETAKLQRHVIVATPLAEMPPKPFRINKDSLDPSEDMQLAADDMVRVSFQGTPQASAEFSIQGVARHIPMVDRSIVNPSTGMIRGLYEGQYLIQPQDHADDADIQVMLKGRGGKVTQEKARGKLTIDQGSVPRVGLVTEDTVAVRTGPGGSYDLFLYKGMRVRLTGHFHRDRRVQLSSMQTGWVKESAIQELPKGTLPPRSYLNNMVVNRQADSTLLRIYLDDMLPYRTEQHLDPMQLVITVYGAVNKTDVVRYDPYDTVIREVRWRQIGPDTCQIIIDPRFHKWWGYDVRYEGNTLVVEIRKPWVRETLKGMTIAVDPGHGGSELGAAGPHGTLEKDGNLAIARVVRDVLEAAGARVVMTRDSDMDVPLYERPKIAWRNRAHLFVSVHCNSSGVGDNPLVNNGHSTYFYHPQSMALARAVHGQYAARVNLPDRGLFYADFAVCRMTQMPSILTEQAYIILPEQEQLIFSPAFHRRVADSILNGIRAYIAK